MKLSEFVDINPRTSLPKGTEAEFVPMEALNPHRRYVKTYPKKKYSGGTKFINGDTLFARITPCLENGKISQFVSDSNQPAFGSTEYWIFRSKQGVSDPSYVYYLAKSELLRRPAEKSMVGASGRQRAQIESIQNLDVGNVSLAEQKTIASVLSAYDDLIENNSKRIEKLEAMARLLFNNIFISTGTEIGTLLWNDFYELPENWRVGKLADLCTLVTDGTHESLKSQNSGYHMVSAKDIGGGFIDFSRTSYISKYDHKKIMNRSKPEYGDILYSKIGTMGNVALVKEKFEFSIKNVALFKPHDNLSNYLYCYFSNTRVAEKLEQEASGTSQKFISLNYLRNNKVAVPDDITLEKFNSYVGPILNQKHKLYTLNIYLANARDLLLPRLMSGEIKV